MSTVPEEAGAGRRGGPEVRFGRLRLRSRVQGRPPAPESPLAELGIPACFNMWI